MENAGSYARVFYVSRRMIIGSKRHENFAAAMCECRGHDSDHVVRPIVQQKFLTDNRGISAESSHPESMRKNGDLRTVRLIFRFRVPAAQLWLQTENIHQRCGCRNPGHSCRIALSSHRE